MSSNKSRFKVIRETLISLSEEVNASAKNSRRAAEEQLREANSMRIESAEKLCLTYALRHPDGKELKGECAIFIAGILKEALLVDEVEDIFNDFKAAGFIHN